MSSFMRTLVSMLVVIALVSSCCEAKNHCKTKFSETSLVTSQSLTLKWSSTCESEKIEKYVVTYSTKTADDIDVSVEESAKGTTEEESKTSSKMSTSVVEVKTLTASNKSEAIAKIKQELNSDTEEEGENDQEEESTSSGSNKSDSNSISGDSKSRKLKTTAAVAVKASTRQIGKVEVESSSNSLTLTRLKSGSYYTICVETVFADEDTSSDTECKVASTIPVSMHINLVSVVIVAVMVFAATGLTSSYIIKRRKRKMHVEMDECREKLIESLARHDEEVADGGNAGQGKDSRPRENTSLLSTNYKEAPYDGW